MKDHKLEDALQSLLAQCHHIQNRLLQSACKGSMSRNVAEELVRHAESMAERFGKISAGE